MRIISGYNIQITASAPAYWDRDNDITVYVTFSNRGYDSFFYSGNIYAYIKDKYYENEDWTWTVEALSSKSANFVISSGESKTVSLIIHTPTTTIGLKKVAIAVTGSLSKTIDLGYNFVQKANKNEYPEPSLCEGENPFENSDQVHSDLWTVIKKAGEAADVSLSSKIKLYDTALEVCEWVYNHFIYDSTTILIENNDKIFTYSNLTAADIYILNHVFPDGKYHGVCDEYTTLYISFMRALNIASRYIIILMKDNRNNYVGHAFAEVWVDNQSGYGYSWVHVDPTWCKINSPNIYKNSYKEILALAIWQEADDSYSTYDIWDDDYLLATRIDISNAYPSTQYADFKVGISYCGLNNYQ
ncbi:MAG: transglutaminase-like domain-containing protein [Candidatus Asgardarchaeia archaeon]